MEKTSPRKELEGTLRPLWCYNGDAGEGKAGDPSSGNRKCENGNMVCLGNSEYMRWHECGARREVGDEDGMIGCVRLPKLAGPAKELDFILICLGRQQMF